jgi:hypothetical protein
MRWYIHVIRFKRTGCLVGLVMSDRLPTLDASTVELYSTLGPFTTPKEADMVRSRLNVILTHQLPLLSPEGVTEFLRAV